MLISVMRAAGGRVELGDRRPHDPPLPEDLQVALREWAAFAAAAGRSGGEAERDLVRRRGRQLASRVAGLRGRPVEFLDPVSGDVESVRAPLALVPDGDPDGPVPWATGLPVAAFTAVVVGLADVLLSQAFARAFGLWWVPANLVVCAGLAPSLWLLRTVPFWRWPALGTAVGLATAWVALLAALLG
jgi:hypothetical protein